MVRHRILKDRDIKELLAQLEGGEISEDDAESDGDDLELYPSFEELQAILEEEEIEEEPTGMADEENLIEEPGSLENLPVPLINEDTPSTSSRDPYVPINTQNLRWRKASLPFCENEIQFHGVTDYAQDIMNLQTPYQFFTHFFIPDILGKIVEQTNLYSEQPKYKVNLGCYKAPIVLMTSICSSIRFF